MVAKGTYTELQQSGVDFTSLLNNEEEEQQAPQDVHNRIRTLSQNSVRSRSSSMHSVKDGDQLPVCYIVSSLETFAWLCLTNILRLFLQSMAVSF